MGFLFGKPKTEADELRKCLQYLEEEGKLVIFRGKQEDFYNDVLAKYGQSYRTDSHAAEEMCRAANRLVQAAKEILSRRANMVSVPDVASNMYWAWQRAYLAYQAHVEAEYAALVEEAKGMTPNYEYLRRCHLQSEDLYHKALKEERKLAKRLKLSGDVVRKMYNDASAAVAAENWEPEDFKYT